MSPHDFGENLVAEKNNEIQWLLDLEDIYSAHELSITGPIKSEAAQ